MKKLIIAMVLLFIVFGCSSFNPRTPQEAIVLQLSVKSSVAEVLKDHPTWARPTVSITSAAISAIDAKTVLDLGSTASYIKSKIETDKLEPVEIALLSVLIDRVVDGIQMDLKARGIKAPSEEMVQVRTVLIWVRDMAEL